MAVLEQVKKETYQEKERKQKEKLDELSRMQVVLADIDRSKK